MDFDHFTVGLLVLRDDAPALDDVAAAQLQDAHMAHLADLYDAGHIVAVGPLADDRLRGLIVFTVDPERALELELEDPAVSAGRFHLEVIPWMVPGGTIAFPPGRVPRSMAEVVSRRSGVDGGHEKGSR